ncbi:glycosyltransferase [Campylobacter pinnipediorum]|uniref:glycosyltransferase n=1 Tax=Campylobacter pinnipediorum TaxID=1965231 RepID=UPI000A4ACA2D|nr:glycosyltransferase [Campylobacter pinnipediorum]
MEQIKVLHTEWSDGWGGQEIRIITESIALKEKYNVDITIACRKNSQISKQAKKVGIKVVYFDFKSSFDIKSILSIYKFIKENKIQIVNTHSGKDTWVGGLAAKLARVKFIRTRHLSNPINSSRFNFINELADFIMTTGENVRKDMIANNRISPDKIKSIPTGIDDSLFDDSLYNKDDCLEKLNIDKDKIYVGSLAVLRGVKRLDILLNIALKIHKDFENVVFLIAGDGPGKESLSNFITKNNMQDYVKLMGHISKPYIFLKAIDIFIMTSRSEGVPQSLMQALLMKKACISTNVGGVKDLYDSKNFSCVEFDEQKIQQALVEILKDNKIKNDFEKNAKEYVKNNFTRDIMAKNIYDIYLQILKL